MVAARTRVSGTAHPGRGDLDPLFPEIPQPTYTSVGRVLVLIRYRPSEAR